MRRMTSAPRKCLAAGAEFDGETGGSEKLPCDIEVSLDCLLVGNVVGAAENN
ncbi:MAG TPA: hypothetical protein VE077_04375 [Candidatus Methylomirabilis sp.]|nr:hypothetical protein [Candidatus Methylomirabilis sp.]